MPGLVAPPQRDASWAGEVAVGSERVAQIEAVQRDEDVGRYALAEALGGLVTCLTDDDVEVRRLPQLDRRGQPGRAAADDEDVTVRLPQREIELPLPHPRCGEGFALNGHSATTLTDWPSVGSRLAASRKKSGGKSSPVIAVP